MDEIAKIEIPRNTSVYFSVGTGLAREKDMLKEEAPKDFMDLTVQKAIDYVLGQDYEGREKQSMLAANIQRTMRSRRRLVRRGWAVELNGMPVLPKDSLDKYLAATGASADETPEEVVISFKISQINGGGINNYL